MADLKKALADIKKTQAPSLRAPAHTPKPPKVEEAPPPLLTETKIPKKDQQVMTALADAMVAIVQQESDLRKQKDELSAKLKALCTKYEVDRVSTGDVRIAYFNSPRRTIKPELLLQHGVKPTVIEASTQVTDAWTLKVTAVKAAD